MEGNDVTMLNADVFGRVAHREIKIQGCENGWIVTYKVVNPESLAAASQNKYMCSPTLSKTAVFTTKEQLMAFIAEYWEDKA